MLHVGVDRRRRAEVPLAQLAAEFRICQPSQPARALRGQCVSRRVVVGAGQRFAHDVVAYPLLPELCAERPRAARPKSHPVLNPVISKSLVIDQISAAEADHNFLNDIRCHTVLSQAPAYLGRRARSGPQELERPLIRMLNFIHAAQAGNGSRVQLLADSQLRGDLIGALGILGDDKPIQDRARELYDQYKKSADSVERNIIPALVAIFIRGRVRETENLLIRWIKRAYEPTVRLALAGRWTVVSAAVVAPIASVTVAASIVVRSLAICARTARSSPDTLAVRFTTVPEDSVRYARNIAAIFDVLVNRHGFTLSSDDSASLRYVYSAFFVFGPSVSYTSRPSVPGPTFGAVEVSPAIAQTARQSQKASRKAEFTRNSNLRRRRDADRVREDDLVRAELDRLLGEAQHPLGRHRALEGAPERDRDRDRRRKSVLARAGDE